MADQRAGIAVAHVGAGAPLMGYSQSVQSLRNLYFRVEDRFGVKDPTVDAVSMAFVPVGTEPAAGDYKVCSWFTDTATGFHYAVALVGPAGTFALGRGVYQAWLKFTDNPEIPADPVAPITIT